MANPCVTTTRVLERRYSKLVVGLRCFCSIHLDLITAVGSVILQITGQVAVAGRTNSEWAMFEDFYEAVLFSSELSGSCWDLVDHHPHLEVVLPSFCFCRVVSDIC